MHSFKNIRISTLVSILLLLVCRVVNAQPNVRDEQVANNLKQHVEYLCSSELMGRSTTTGHDTLAAQYIDSVFLSYKLMGMPCFSEATYAQKFNVYNTISAKQQLLAGDRPFLFKDDFVYVGVMPPMDSEFEVVFGGVFDEQRVRNMNLRGKALLVFAKNFGLISIQVQQVAADAGCPLVLVVNPLRQSGFYSLSRNIRADAAYANFCIDPSKEPLVRSLCSQSKGSVPVVFITDRVAESILRVCPKDLLKKIEQNEPLGLPSNLPEILFSSNSQVDTLPTQNVVGWIAAQKQTQQSVVVGAHFDHLAPHGQNWYPGADDNASGTAVMLEVARLLSEDLRTGYKPRRNIVFAGFTAEEIGLLGSQYYSLNPVFCTDSSAAFINIDMVGRLTKAGFDYDYIYVDGNNDRDIFLQTLNSLNSDSTLIIDSKMFTTNQILSDHYHYDNLGLPSYLITTGLHNDYHRPTDTPEKLSYIGMTKIVRLVYEAIRYYANAEDPW
ncbi:MAG: M28 family peptidase [Bacteroidales bacterium]|nr:M28 family peptidase [Bacteroidales bacterium]